MKSLLKHKLILFLVVCSSLVILFLCGGYAVGFAHANVDLIIGHPKYLVYGLSDPKKEAKFAQRLLADYSIQHKRIAGCTIIGPEANYADSYDFVIRSFYNRQKGKDVIYELEREVFSNPDTAATSNAAG
jgi:hypothetical protein